MTNYSKPAIVRMRGQEWFLRPETALRLQALGAIWEDRDCEQNTLDNGYLDEGPCFGITGESESIEEATNAALVAEWEDA